MMTDTYSTATARATIQHAAADYRAAAYGYLNRWFELRKENYTAPSFECYEEGNAAQDRQVECITEADRLSAAAVRAQLEAHRATFTRGDRARAIYALRKATATRNKATRNARTAARSLEAATHHVWLDDARAARHA